MEIPGIAPFSGQPTLTNPPTQERLLDGQETQAQTTSEAQNTVSANEQESTQISNTEAVNQTNETDATGFDSNNPGGTIDITA
ncbi:MAG TPA: hypothetical protein ENK70_07755 [Methylophaga sp.]|nr:hypothetical protein [Methylophaga sp.]